MTTSDATTCRGCGKPFMIEGIFAGREPARCRPCAALHRARLLPALGTVISSGPKFVVIEVRGGRRFRAVESYEGEFPPGARVAFEHDPGPAEPFRLSLARNPELVRPAK